jgi:hypothetical protein
MPLLTFPIQTQQAKEWCWIACAVSTDHYYNPGSAWDQGSLANAMLGLTICSTTPVPDQCDKPGQFKNSIGYVQRLRTAVSTPILLSGIQAEIDASDPIGHPVCAGIQWADEKVGHLVVICGYDNSAGTDYIYVADPGTGTIHHLPYNSFLTSYEGKGTWTNTYFTEP